MSSVFMFSRPAYGPPPTRYHRAMPHVVFTPALQRHVTVPPADVEGGTVREALDRLFGVKLHRSTDGGETWQECGTPAYPPKPEGLDDRDGNGKPVEWRTEMIWALANAGPDQPDALWCGTLPGGLFRSKDGGSSWELN